eukprot:3188687-Prorocentrum_lima.AAC.1
MARQKAPTGPSWDGWPLVELLGPLDMARPIRKAKKRVELPGVPKARLTWENGFYEEYYLDFLGSGAGRS